MVAGINMEFGAADIRLARMPIIDSVDEGRFWLIIEAFIAMKLMCLCYAFIYMMHIILCL